MLYRYSLKTAIDEKYVKIFLCCDDETKLPENVRFSGGISDTSISTEKYSKVKPLTILITKILRM